MLDNWLDFLAPDYNRPRQLPAGALGRRILIYQGEGNLADTQVVLLGLDAKTANLVREELYSLRWAFGDLQLADLGNVRRAEVDFLIPLLRELLESRLFPILIGQDPTWSSAPFQAFLGLRDLISLAVVDEQVPLTVKFGRQPTAYLNPILHHRRQSLFHLSLIGAQAHFTPPSVFDWLERQNFECIRLGKARTDLGELEPLVRDADLLYFHLSALKRCEAPAQINPSPSGFFLEEACQICRYAGMSDKLRLFSLFGLDGEAEPVDLQPSAASIAQLLWYLIDGFYHRKHDYPVTNEGLTEYIVDLKDLDTQLTFWKSNRSGRWWMQVPVKTSRKYQRHRLIPCSYSDYKLACQQELPDRLVNAFRRFP